MDGLVDGWIDGQKEGETKPDRPAINPQGLCKHRTVERLVFMRQFLQTTSVNWIRVF